MYCARFICKRDLGVKTLCHQGSHVNYAFLLYPLLPLLSSFLSSLLHPLSSILSLLHVEGMEEPVKQKESGDGVFNYDYYPHAPGKYTVTITWGGQHIPKR